MNILSRLQRICNHVQVANKIKIGFAVVLLLHISIAILGHYGLDKAEYNRRQYEQFQAKVQHFYEIERLVGELQRNVLLFAHGGYQGPASTALQLQDELAQLLDSTVSQSPEERDPMMVEMQQHLQQHREILEAVVEDRGKQSQLVDKDLLKCTAAFDQSIATIRNSQPIEPVSLLRINEAFQHAAMYCLQYVHSLDSEHLVQLRRDLESVRGYIGMARVELPIAAASLDQVSQVVDDFESLVTQVQQTLRGYLHLVNVVLAGETREFLYLTAQTRNAYTTKAAQLGQLMAADGLMYRTYSNLFSIATIGIGVVAAWLIQRSIAPLKTITAIFDRLAHGEPCPPIPGRERDDELGKLAVAADVFRTKAEQTQRLLAEVERLREQDKQFAHLERLDSLGRLASGIAHEINTPLQCVASNVEFLEESYSSLTTAIDQCLNVINSRAASCDQDEVRLRELLASKQIQLARKHSLPATTETANAVRKVVEIIRAMKAMSHPGRAEKTLCDMNRLIDDATKLTRNQWNDYADLDLQLQELPRLEIHPAEITQALINLIINAADAIESQHKGTTERGKITITSQVHCDEVVVEIRDTGVGIPEVHRERIFEPFFTTKDVGKGTGQGLSITYDIVVNRHKGAIRALPVPNGSCLQLTLPIGEARPQFYASEAVCAVRA